MCVHETYHETTLKEKTQGAATSGKPGQSCLEVRSGAYTISMVVGRGRPAIQIQPLQSDDLDEMFTSQLT